VKKKSETSICVYGAGVMYAHVQALKAEIAGVRQATDIECVHRMRVASRRLRSTLPLFGGCLPQKKRAGWERQIRSITRSLGAARDNDVQIEKVAAFQETLADHAPQRYGIARLILRLRQQRSANQERVDRALERLEENQTVTEMESWLLPIAARQNQVYLYNPALYELALQAIRENLEAFESYRDDIYQPERVAELHAMRIAAKHLRYTLETFTPLYGGEIRTCLQSLRKAQETLGDIHDCDVWIDFLPRFLEEERQRTLDYFGHERPIKRLANGIQFYLLDRGEERQRLYHKFVRDWEKWQAEGVWNALRQTIQAPLAGPPPAPEPPPAGIP